MKYMAPMLFDEYLKPQRCALLDELAQKMTKLPKQRFASSGAVIDYSRVLWKEGITTLTDLEAKYRVGVLFTVVILA
jgi:hypothetical protein